MSLISVISSKEILLSLHRPDPIQAVGVLILTADGTFTLHRRVDSRRD